MTKGIIMQHEPRIIEYQPVYIYNLTQLIKYKGIKISDMETYLNVPRGYFNRTKNENITFEVIYKMSKMLNIPLEKFGELLFGGDKQ